MTDKREDVLVRLLAIAAGVDGIATAVRNRSLMDDEEQPAVQILDADETAEAQDPPRSTNNAPRRISMAPEIYISLGAEAENLGTDLNLLRARLLKAILTDAELKTILGANGEARYEGCATALSRGRNMQGELGLSMSFVYILRPADL